MIKIFSQGSEQNENVEDKNSKNSKKMPIEKQKTMDQPLIAYNQKDLTSHKD